VLKIAGFRRKRPKKKKKSHGANDAPRRTRTPKRNEGEMFAIVKKMHGTNQIKAVCEDGLERMCRITGKMKKRVWMREGDLIIIMLWDFQPIKADIKWRYTGGQKNFLEKMGYLRDFGMTAEEKEKRDQERKAAATAQASKPAEPTSEKTESTEEKPGANKEKSEENKEKTSEAKSKEDN